MVNYLNPANYRPARIIKTNQEVANRLDFKDIKFSIRITHIQKMEKKVKDMIILYTEEENIFVVIADAFIIIFLLVINFVSLS